MQSIKKYSSRIEFVDSVLNQSNLKILDIGGGVVSKYTRVLSTNV